MLRKILEEISNEGLIDKIKNKWNELVYKTIDSDKFKKGTVFVVEKNKNVESIVTLKDVDFDENKFIFKTLWGKNYDGKYSKKEIDDEVKFLQLPANIFSKYERFDEKNVKPLINFLKLLEKGRVKGIMKNQKEFYLSNSNKTIVLKKDDKFNIIDDINFLKENRFSKIRGSYKDYTIDIVLSYPEIFEDIEFINI